MPLSVKIISQIKCRFPCASPWYIRPAFGVSTLSHFAFLKVNIEEEKVESYSAHIHTKNMDRWISQSMLLTIKQTNKQTNIG